MHLKTPAISIIPSYYMDFYIHMCQGCCYPSLFLCCPKTWNTWHHPACLSWTCPLTAGLQGQAWGHQGGGGVVLQAGKHLPNVPGYIIGIGGEGQWQGWGGGVQHVKRHLVYTLIKIFIWFFPLVCWGTLGWQQAAGWTGNDLATGYFQMMLLKHQGRYSFEDDLVPHTNTLLIIRLRIRQFKLSSQPKRKKRLRFWGLLAGLVSLSFRPLVLFFITTY